MNKLVLSLALLCSGACATVYDSLNDEQMKKYCESKGELSDACVEYVRFMHAMKQQEALSKASDPQKTLKLQRKTAKKMGEVVHAIGKEMFAEDTNAMLTRNDK